MLLRKTAWFWKSGLAVISFVLMFSISGCSDTPPEEDTVSETVIDVQDVSEEEQENEEEIINICIDLYDKAAEENEQLLARDNQLRMALQFVKTLPALRQLR